MDEQADSRRFEATLFPRGLAAAVAHVAQVLGSTLAGVFFIGSPWIGAILWLAISANPRFPLFALTGLVVGDGVAALLGARGMGADASFRFNAALTSIAVAWLLTISGYSIPLQLLIAAFFAGVTSILSATILSTIRGSALPPLVWAFCLVVGVLFTLFPVWANGAAQALVHWPQPVDARGWVESAFRSLGSLVFLPRPEVGLMVAAAILLWSRAMFVMGAVGWLSGIATCLLFQRLGLNHYWLLASHNYFLAGMLLGAVHFLPGRASIPVAAIAGVSAATITAFLQYFLPSSPWAFLPIPAATATWLGIGALTFGDARHSPRRNLTPTIAPELGWWRAERWSRVFGDREPLLIVPLAEPTHIAQSFDGPLSHAGRWKYAVDFQQTLGAKNAEPGGSLWNAPVYAPASGIVERCRGDVPDNPFGMSNFADNWGNHVVVRLDAGGRLLLAHLQQGSLAVVSGQSVATGAYIGRVGNSGRSPVPHLHMQAQIGPLPGADTIPFRLANFMTAGDARGALTHWNAAGVPDEGAIVMGARAEPAVLGAVASFAPGHAIWQVRIEGEIPRDYRRYESGSLAHLHVSLNEAGQHVLETQSAGSLLIAMDPDAWRVLDASNARCPLLRLMALALPSIPYAAAPGVTWREPSPLPPRGWLAPAKLLIAPYLPDPFGHLACACLDSPSEDEPRLVIQTVIENASAGSPERLTSHIEPIRGPTKIEAEFREGSLSMSLLSFEPRLQIKH